MNTHYPISRLGEIAEHEEAVNQFVADTRRGQSCVVFFNDAGDDILILPPQKQRLVEIMAKRILTSETEFSK